MNDLKDFIIGLGSNIKDRFSNPLVSSFLISWLIINYRFVITLFGEINVGGNWIDKINYINLVLWNGYNFYLDAFVFPFLSAIAWVYFVTPILRMFIIYERKRVNLLKAKVLRVDRTKTLTKAEEINLRMHVTKEWIKIANQEEESSKALQKEIEKSVLLIKENSNLKLDIVNKEKLIKEKEVEVEKEKGIVENKNDEISMLKDSIRPKDIYTHLNKENNDFDVFDLLNRIGFNSVSNFSFLNELVINDTYKISFPLVVKANLINIIGSRLILARNDIFTDYSFILLHELYEHNKVNGGLIFINEIKEICDKYDLNLIGSINELVKLKIITIKNFKLFVENSLSAEIESKANDVYHLFTIFGFRIKTEST